MQVKGKMGVRKDKRAPVGKKKNKCFYSPWNEPLFLRREGRSNLSSIERKAKGGTGKDGRPGPGKGR